MVSSLQGQACKPPSLGRLANSSHKIGPARLSATTKHSYSPIGCPGSLGHWSSVPPAGSDSCSYGTSAFFSKARRGGFFQGPDPRVPWRTGTRLQAHRVEVRHSTFLAHSRPPLRTRKKNSYLKRKQGQFPSSHPVSLGCCSRKSSVIITSRQVLFDLGLQLSPEIRSLSEKFVQRVLPHFTNFSCHVG